MKILKTVYNASHTLSKFHKSNAFVRGVRGPVGSGSGGGRKGDCLRGGRREGWCP